MALHETFCLLLRNVRNGLPPMRQLGLLQYCDFGLTGTPILSRADGIEVYSLALVP